MIIVKVYISFGVSTHSQYHKEMENIAGGQYNETVSNPPGEVHLFHPKNPVDKEVLHYIKQIQTDETPSQSQQRNLVKGIYRKDEKAKTDLLALNRGLLASIAFAFDARSFDTSADMIQAGSTALLNAAETYDFKGSKTSFTNYAIPQLHQAMQQVMPDVELPYSLNDETPPLHTIYKYLSTLKKEPTLDSEGNAVNHEPEAASTPLRPINAAKAEESGTGAKAETWLDFTVFEMRVIPFLPLDRSTIMEITGMRNVAVQMAISKLARRTRTLNQQALALCLHTEGYKFVIPTPKTPFNDFFKPHEIEIIQNLHLSKQELAFRFGISADTVSSLIYEARVQSGAKTTTELLLMAHMYGQGRTRTNDERTDGTDV